MSYNSIYGNDYMTDASINGLTYEELLSLDNSVVSARKPSMNKQQRAEIIKKGTKAVVWEADGKSKSEECVICLEQYEDKKTSVTTMKCEHCFHDKCLQQWFKVDLRCPTCRQDVRGEY